MIKKYQSLKDHVYNYIAQKIQNGTLLPNQKVNEASICKNLEVSRTPVREALIQLASENLLEYIPRRGFIVSDMDTKKKLDIFQVVGVLDGFAATLAVDHLTDEDIQTMEKLVAKIDIAIDRQNYADYQKYQTDFHYVYINKCDNSTLIDMLNSLQNSFIRQVYLSQDKQKLFDALKEMNHQHKQIIDFFKQADKENLEDLLRNVHWKITHTDMI
ncbi:GntR family transcriptional regulator [Shimazuella soli]|uniref:GntR family transcriptional regulator n=1 Tax=Shimazuella soli TaxID=1892854 RepID=UPI0030B823C2